MPLIRSLASKCCTCVVVTILSFSKIMPFYFYCEKKKLIYVMIIAPSNHQPFFYIKCAKLNIYLSCNVRLVLNAKYISFIRLIIL